MCGFWEDFKKKGLVLFLQPQLKYNQFWPLRHNNGKNRLFSLLGKGQKSIIIATFTYFYKKCGDFVTREIMIKTGKLQIHCKGKGMLGEY